MQPPAGPPPEPPESGQPASSSSQTELEQQAHNKQQHEIGAPMPLPPRMLVQASPPHTPDGQKIVVPPDKPPPAPRKPRHIKKIRLSPGAPIRQLDFGDEGQQQQQQPAVGGSSSSMAIDP